MTKKIVMYDTVQDLIDPIPISVDLVRLYETIQVISRAVGYDPNECFKSKSKKSTINFTYPKNIPQSIINAHGDLKSKFIGPLTQGEDRIKELYNIGTNEFTEMHPIIEQSYIKTVFDQIQQYHTSKFGSGAIRWVHSSSLAPGAAFGLHIDLHCIARYHIALITTECSYMMVNNDNEIKTVHIPADGRVWLLDNNVQHTAINLVYVDKETDRVRTHLIFSVYD